MLSVEIIGCICINTVSDQEFTHIFREFLISYFLFGSHCEMRGHKYHTASQRKGQSVLDSSTGRCYFRENIQTKTLSCMNTAFVWHSPGPGRRPGPADLPGVSGEDKLPKLPVLPGSTAGSSHQEAVSNPPARTPVCRNVAPLRCR